MLTGLVILILLAALTGALVWLVDAFGRIGDLEHEVKCLRARNRQSDRTAWRKPARAVVTQIPLALLTPTGARVAGLPAGAVRLD